MIRRPTPVTAIAWIFIVFGVFELISLSVSVILPNPAKLERMAQLPVPVSIQYAVSIIGALVDILSGCLLLKGKNAGRWLYAIWSPLRLVYGLVLTKYKLTLSLGVLIYSVIVYFLFRQDANAFFSAGGENAALQTRPSARRVLSTACYCVAGFCLVMACFMGFFAMQMSIAKLLLVSFVLLPGFVFLSIGRVLSPGLSWMREVGMVFLWSAITGALMALTLTLCAMDPEFQKSVAQKRHFVGDYVSGGLWTAGLFLIGLILLHMARRQENTPPVRAPIPKVKRR